MKLKQNLNVSISDYLEWVGNFLLCMYLTLKVYWFSIKKDSKESFGKNSQTLSIFYENHDGLCCKGASINYVDKILTLPPSLKSLIA